MTYAPDRLQRGSATLARWRIRLRVAASQLLAPRREQVPLSRGWAWPVLLLWAIGRAVNLAFLWAAFQLARAGKWTFGPDSEPVSTFLRFLTGWDADRYGVIATQGYPVVLPVDLEGDIQRNNWAFLPVFPFLERALSDAAGISWHLAGVLISVGASAGATVVLYALLRSVTAPGASWWAVVLFCLGPLSFVFVIGYAESLYLLLIFSALLLAVRRRYLWIAPIGAIAAFTRPGAVALALALGILLLARWMLRAQDPLPRSQLTGLAVSGAVTAIAGLMWPVVAAVVTGEPGAYVRTEMAWWVPFLGDADLLPLTPGLVMAWTWLGVVGVVLALCALFAVFRWILSAPVRALGLEIVAFALSYVLYLLAVFLPTQSLFRLVLPLSPLLADGRLSQSRRRQWWCVAACLTLQAAAVCLLWTIGNP
ncbi:hypothetical protein NQ152_13490 [Microbacterium sp. zg.B48]|uniref:hypothetical protein n=1 Tax=Microbacterium sp. zg.B48 TaxID=2969408 RepID=UPI00214C99C5|nr:hypothetical protein [Microbacterium sp. zg.B48]MCR2764519.1 hypothetical protein [Microbacterium sp. zg.B48]